MNLKLLRYVWKKATQEIMASSFKFFLWIVKLQSLQ